ncbi:MAG: sugar transferase [Deferribacteres bacterium]|nr:sugar transferase [candidate division KSB1 bacterium]MCB9510860.1 sugar transferase [Deferribacteres bacterium]
MNQRQLVGQIRESMIGTSHGSLTPEIVHQRYQALVDRNKKGIPVEANRKVVLSDFDIKLRKFVGTYFLSPFFFFSTLSVLLFFPEDLIRRITTPLSSMHYWELAGKRIFDIFSAVLGFIFCSMFFVVIPLLIKFDSRGPIFYRQRRSGVNNRKRDRRVINLEVTNDRRKEQRRKVDLYGRPFWVYKFRTMRQDAEKGSGAVWAQKNDPRITPMGNILRFTHVDEIPQFFNVLCGEMSLVGPRPERPQLIPQILEKVPNYTDRLLVKPGLTGIAQIVCGYDVTIEGTKDKLKWDLIYVENSNLKADVVILLQTLWVIIRGKEVLEANNPFILGG